MTIKELMTRDVATVSPQHLASTAARLMWDRDCGALPVVDENQRVLGMITDRDICMAALHRDGAPSAFAVADAMSRRLFSCSPGDSISAAEQIMCDNQVRRLPVVDKEGRLVGILSLADVVRVAQPGASKAASPQDVAATMARICARPDGLDQPRPQA